MASRAKKNFWWSDLLAPSASTIGDFEHAYVYWIWLRGFASYVIIDLFNSSAVLKLYLEFIFRKN